MRRLNIYFMHSEKFDYNNLIYKDVLSSRVCLNHNIILPRTKTYESVYAKDLIRKADLVVAFLNNPSFGLNIELRWLKKFNKKTLFLCLDENVPKRYLKKYKDVKIVTTEHYFITLTEKFIKENENDDVVNNNTVVLGKL